MAQIKLTVLQGNLPIIVEQHHDERTACIRAERLVRLAYQSAKTGDLVITTQSDDQAMEQRARQYIAGYLQDLEFEASLADVKWPEFTISR